MDDSWGKWARDNSDKILLTLILFGFLGFTTHVLHDARDNDQVQFLNGLTNTFSGALITLVTGAVIRRAHTEPPKEPKP